MTDTLGISVMSVFRLRLDGRAALSLFRGQHTTNSNIPTPQKWGSTSLYQTRGDSKSGWSHGGLRLYMGVIGCLFIGCGQGV